MKIAVSLASRKTDGSLRVVANLVLVPARAPHAKTLQRSGGWRPVSFATSGLLVVVPSVTGRKSLTNQYVFAATVQIRRNTR